MLVSDFGGVGLQPTRTERIRLLETLDKEDQQALIRIIDSMLTKKKMMEVLTDKTALEAA